MDTTTTMDTTACHRQIRGGMTVYGADGDKVGKVTEVGPAYITVEKGFFVTTDYYAPTSAIAAVGDREIHLTVPIDEVVSQGWDLKPADWDAAAYAEAEVLAAEYAAASATIAPDRPARTRDAGSPPAACRDLDAPAPSLPVPSPGTRTANDDTRYVVVAANTASGWTQYDAFVRRLGTSPATTVLYDPQQIDEAFTDLRATRAEGLDAVLVILSL